MNKNFKVKNKASNKFYTSEGPPKKQKKLTTKSVTLTDLVKLADWWILQPKYRFAIINAWWPNISKNLYGLKGQH